MAKRGAPGSPAPQQRGRAALRDLLRTTGRIELRSQRMLDAKRAPVVGVFYRGRVGGTVVPADRRNRAKYRVAERDVGGAADGDLVRVEQLPAGDRGTLRARVVERLGHSSDPGAVSLLAIASHDIPT